MGMELLSESPAYRRGVEACAGALKPFGIDLIAAFSDEAGFSEDPIVAAVGLIALQVLPLESLQLVLHETNLEKGPHTEISLDIKIYHPFPLVMTTAK